jgi:ankyrin repeat protein
MMNHIGTKDIMFSFLKFEYSLIQLIEDMGTNPNFAAIKSLLENTPDVLNKTDKYGRTPLMCAVLIGNIHFVRYLISKNANLNVIANDSYTALRWAYKVGHREILLALIQAGAVDTSLKGKYLIHELAANGDLEAVTLLLEKDPDLLNKKDENEQTPLEYISLMQLDEIEAVKRFLTQAISTQTKNELDQAFSQSDERRSVVLPSIISESIFHQKQIRKLDVVDQQNEFSWVNKWST